MSNWIKCSERLPETGMSVNVWGFLGSEHAPSAHEAFLSRTKTIRWKSVRSDPLTEDWMIIRNVTHWQPLPPPPET